VLTVRAGFPKITLRLPIALVFDPPMPGMAARNRLYQTLLALHRHE
jgi:hypothetical protein